MNKTCQRLCSSQCPQTQRHTHVHTLGFLFDSQRISKKLIRCCDNYPCCSLMAHLHNHHQPFTEDTQRIIMRQQRNKRHLGEPLKSCTVRAHTVSWFGHRMSPNSEGRCSGDHTNALANVPLGFPVT